MKIVPYRQALHMNVCMVVLRGLFYSTSSPCRPLKEILI